MKCPYCQNLDTSVLDSRDSEDLASIRRRRECLSCNKRFTTYERTENIDLVVIKKDGRRENFDRNKLLTGFLKACQKRPISRDLIDQTIQKIEMELRNLDSTEIPSQKIGELVMSSLRKIDKVAYIRFASVYRQFADIESFEKELRSLLKKR